MGSFDVDAYKAELERTAFDAASIRLDANGWELVRAGEGEFGAWKRVDTGVMHEISLPSLVRIEAACAEYDERQEARAGAARERAREQERLDRQARLEGELARSLREAEQKLAVEEALRSL